MFYKNTHFLYLTLLPQNVVGFTPMRGQYNLEQFCDMLVHNSVSIFFRYGYRYTFLFMYQSRFNFFKWHTCMVHLTVFILCRYPMWRVPASTFWTYSYPLINAIATLVHPVMSRLCTPIYMFIVCNSLPDNECAHPKSSIALSQRLLLVTSHIAGRVWRSDTTNGEHHLVTASTTCNVPRRWQSSTQRHH